MFPPHAAMLSFSALIWAASSAEQPELDVLKLLPPAAEPVSSVPYLVRGVPITQATPPERDAPPAIGRPSAATASAQVGLQLLACADTL